MVPSKDHRTTAADELNSFGSDLLVRLDVIAPSVTHCVCRQ